MKHIYVYLAFNRKTISIIKNLWEKCVNISRWQILFWNISGEVKYFDWESYQIEERKNWGSWHQKMLEQEKISFSLPFYFLSKDWRIFWTDLVENIIFYTDWLAFVLRYLEGKAILNCIVLEKSLSQKDFSTTSSKTFDNTQDFSWTWRNAQIFLLCKILHLFKICKNSFYFAGPWVVWSSTLGQSLGFQFFKIWWNFLFDEIYVVDGQWYQPLDAEEEFLERQKQRASKVQ